MSDQAVTTPSSGDQPGTMLAMVFQKNGGPAVIEPMTLPIPACGENDVLVRVGACGLNHLDLWVRDGLPGKIPMPHIGGCETVGHVVRVGTRVSDLPVGQLVMISPTQGCGRCPACLNENEPACPDFVVPGEDTQGGFAEYVVSQRRHVIPLSNRWSPVEWAATPLVFLTAWRMLHRQARIAAGDNVLVHGAASGVGSAAIQIARAAGASVIATASTPAKAALAAATGAHHVVNTANESFVDVVKRVTSGRGVDIVFEHVGSAVFKDSLKSLAHGGRIVTCGATTGPKVEIDLRFFFIREIAILGSCMGSRRELDVVLKLLADGTLRPVVDRVFPLSELAAAQTYLEERRQLGKLVIQVS